MIEAEITCICRSIELPDLNLSLSQKEVAYVPLDASMASQDLAAARNASGVMVRYVQRYHQRRPGPSFKVTSPRPAPPLASVPEVREVPMVVLNEDSLVNRVVDVIRSQTGPVVRQAVQDELAQVRQIVQEELALLRAELLEAIQTRPATVFAQVPGPDPWGKVPAEVEPMPQFIPTNLVDQGAKAEIVTSRSESTDTSVADAAAALRKARKRES